MRAKWEITFSNGAAKQVGKLNKNILSILRLLVETLANQGPALPDWPHYGKLQGKKNNDQRHCHLQRGKPTYVYCWEVIDKTAKHIEVYYVGTHEKAPY